MDHTCNNALKDISRSVIDTCIDLFTKITLL